MKLLQLNVAANWGANGTIAENIGLSAMDMGWESYIAYGRFKNASKSRLIKVGNKFDVYSHYILNRFFDREGLGSVFPTKRLIGKIKEISPDIVHLHDIHDHWLNYPLLFKFLLKSDAKIVWTFHDCWAFTGGCMHFENVRCNKWEKHCENCPGHKSFSFDNSARNFYLKKQLLEPLKSRLTIVCVSEWLKNHVKRSFLSDCRIEVINNGIDLKDFSWESSGKRQNMVLGVANGWPEYKGLSEFIKLREILSSEIEITLVGLSRSQIKSLPKGITGLPRVSEPKKLADLYKKAKVFVNPTFCDTFPTVNLEAQACGTPVVTYDTGGCSETVTPQTGTVVKTGDIPSLASAVNSYIHFDEPFDHEKCFQRIYESFNKNIQYKKYIDLYNSLL